MAKKRKTELDIDMVDEEVAATAPEEPVEVEKEAPPPVVGEEKAPEEEAKEKKPLVPPNVLKLGIVVLTTLLVLGGIGMGVYSYFQNKSQLEEEQKKREEELKKKAELLAAIPKVPLYPMGRFFVPLRDKGKQKFFTLVVTLQMNKEQVANELNKYLPAIREEIYLYLKQKTSSDLRGTGKMAIVAKDLKLLVNRNLQTGVVKKVYFQEYILP